MRSYDDYRKILELWEQGVNKYRIARTLNMPDATVRDCINRFHSVAGLESYIEAHTPQPKDKEEKTYQPAYKQYVPRPRKYTYEQLEQAVKESFSVAQVIEKLGLRPAGGNYALTKQRIEEYGLDTSHFTGKLWIKGKQHPNHVRRDLKEILVKDSNYSSTNDLRQRLIKEGILEYRCVSCGLDRWLDNPIPLELDHINGDNRDHRLENLRLLCPNCHALTPTYRARNKRKL